jgi:hypothetical protein
MLRPENFTFKERMRRFLQEHMEFVCEDRKTLHLKNVSLKDVVYWDAPRIGEN